MSRYVVFSQVENTLTDDLGEALAAAYNESLLVQVPVHVYLDSATSPALLVASVSSPH